jgi:membrane protein DedA with SNARE-associated domain
VQHFLTSYGVAAVFLLMTLESACIPIPSEVIMLVGGAVAAGAFGKGGHSPTVLVEMIIAGVVGNVVGSYIAWAVGKWGGHAVIRRFGRYILLREHDLEKAERWFDKYGPVSVLVGRLLPVIRTFISLPAGIASMRPLRFGLFTAAGCIPWTAAIAVVGYEVGDRYEKISKGFKGPTYAIAAIAALGLAFLAYRHVKKVRAEGAAVPAQQRPPVGGADDESDDFRETTAVVRRRPGGGAHRR